MTVIVFEKVSYTAVKNLPMHWAWAHEKVAVLRRESDGYEPGCSQDRESVRHLSGPLS